MPRVSHCLTLLLISSLLSIGSSTSLRSEDSIAIIPSRVVLSSIEARQRLVVQQQEGKRFAGQIHENVTFSSSDDSVVSVESGMAIPRGNGMATLQATHGNMTTTVAVEVTGQDKPFAWSFRNHVESVLSKAGCNGGACHGARAGQKGFRLTLFGFDLAADHAYLTRQARGRRVIPHDPGRSLILTKPTGLLSHKGGIRFEIDSPEYRVLSEWIAAGAPGPHEHDPVIERLQVHPQYSLQKPRNRQQLVVLAHFSDGHSEDVTRWAKYTSLNSSVASVGKHGMVEVSDSGEGSIKVWYLNHNALSFLSVPYDNEISSDQYTDAPTHTFIDQMILSKLQGLNLPPSPLCDDGTFLRRAYLDTLGVLPTTEETRTFLVNPAPDKRETAIDTLFARPEFVDYWSYKWSDLLLVSGKRLRPKAVQAYYEWIRGQVADNAPWDQLVYDVVTASGNNFENGAANFYALHQSPDAMAETVAQAFMSLSINCAKCHNHPLEKWTNDQYYGMANLFSRVRGKGWGGDSGDNAFEGQRVIFSDVRGELIQPSTGTPQPPRPLDAEPLPFDATADRRIYAAEWLTSAENPYFTRAITNRIWANFFGVGLVEKVDDMRVTNPASNEPLLQAVADYLVANDFDLRILMREILRSASYQRASTPRPENQPDNRFYSRYYARRLKAEVLLDAISQVTDVPSEFAGHPKGTRSLQLPDASIDSYFLAAFGRPERIITCECERSDEPSMTQVFHIYNGSTLNTKLEATEGVIQKLLDSGVSDDAIIEEAYLAALSRYPSDAERQRLSSELAASQDDRRLTIEDLFWSILSSREFLFNH